MAKIMASFSVCSVNPVRGNGLPHVPVGKRPDEAKERDGKAAEEGCV